MILYEHEDGTIEQLDKESDTIVKKSETGDFVCGKNELLKISDKPSKVTLETTLIDEDK